MSYRGENPLDKMTIGMIETNARTILHEIDDLSNTDKL